MRTIGVVTVARSDYGIYLPILRRIQEDPDLRLHLIVAGMHLSPEFGMTINAIEADGFTVSERVEMLLSSDTPEGIAKSMGLGIIGYAQSYARVRPDLLLVLGDRFEMHAAVVASLPFNIPLAHIHGGESTEGAIDEAFRHSITKMSHLHFVATESNAQRVIQMGEEPWRVLLSGAPSLDNLHEVSYLNGDELAREFKLDLSAPFLVVTYHPVTLEYRQTQAQVSELVAALEKVDANTRIIFTHPNADTSSRVIVRAIEEFAARNRRVQVIANLGLRGYFSLMKLATAMVGNSSSGIIEAASFKLPVVDIGNRQRGRLRAENVIDVECTCSAILSGIKKAISPQFRSGLQDLINPYGDGHAAERIVDRLKQVQLNDELLEKRFYQIT